MLRNYLTAALRNLVRNRLYAAINILGLGAGFAAALLIALFVRDEYSFDSYFPDHERIYVLQSSDPEGRFSDGTRTEVAKLLKADFPDIEQVGRLLPGPSISVRRGDVENAEPVLWADPDILKFRPIAVNLANAFAMPDSIILTRAMARKYFGKDAPVGETLELDRKSTFTVTAVIEDLPSNVNRPVTFIAAGQSNSSMLAQLDARSAAPPTTGPQFTYILTGNMTYVKLPDRVTAQRIAEGLPDFLNRHSLRPTSLRPSGPRPPGPPGPPGGPQFFDPPSADPALRLVPLDALHFAPGGEPGTVPRGSQETILAVTAIGLLILVAASINFVNLMTARAGRRATEVGVRKATGAARIDLIAQFIGEALVYVGISMALAMVLTASFLPGLNSFLDRTITLDLLSDPRAGAFIAGLILVVGLLAGIYPAFVLSAFRPAAVLKAGSSQSQASAGVRQVLVVLQFALLIGLLAATAVIGRQIQFALVEAQRLDTDEVVIVSGTCGGSAFRDAVSALPGVRGAVCSSDDAIGQSLSRWSVPGRDGQQLEFNTGQIDPGFFEFYGLRPVAGRFFASDRPADSQFSDLNGGPAVINETAVRKFGFASATEAVGQTLPMLKGTPPEIIGVVPDYAIDTIHAPIEAQVYYVDANGYRVRSPSGIPVPLGVPTERGLLNIRLEGARVPETLQAIDALWKQQGQSRSIERYFLSQDIQARYADILRQGTLFAAFTSVAVVIALLGLFGMAAFTAEQRTKEIGIRKAMGATRRDILHLLLWQFTKPVLWANAIAWPVAYFIMRRWLEGFANHVDLEPWVFLAASTVAALIAAATVIGHALLVARAQPASALRYE